MMISRRLLLLALHASAQIALSPTSTTRVRVFGEDVIAYDARDKIFADVMAHGAAWEPDTAALLAALLAPGDGAIDVGAHVGTNALTMARAVGDAGVVVALEPQRAVHQLLCASVAPAKSTRATVSASQAGGGGCRGGDGGDGGGSGGGEGEHGSKSKGELPDRKKVRPKIS